MCARDSHKRDVRFGSAPAFNNKSSTSNEFLYAARLKTGQLAGPINIIERVRSHEATATPRHTECNVGRHALRQDPLDAFCVVAIRIVVDPFRISCCFFRLSHLWCKFSFSLARRSKERRMSDSISPIEESVSS